MTHTPIAAAFTRLAHTLLDAQFTSTGRYSAHERIAAQYRTHQHSWARPPRDQRLPSTH